MYIICESWVTGRHMRCHYSLLFLSDGRMRVISDRSCHLRAYTGCIELERRVYTLLVKIHAPRTKSATLRDPPGCAHSCGTPSLAQLQIPSGRISLEKLHGPSAKYYPYGVYIPAVWFWKDNHYRYAPNFKYISLSRNFIYTEKQILVLKIFLFLACKSLNEITQC